MKLSLKIGVPYPDLVDKDEVSSVFPYGNIIDMEIVEGGLNCSSGVVIESLGDKTDEFIIACAAVTVGY